MYVLTRPGFFQKIQLIYPLPCFGLASGHLGVLFLSQSLSVAAEFSLLVEWSFFWRLHLADCWIFFRPNKVTSFLSYRKISGTGSA